MNKNETFEQYRPLLFSIGYRMLGSVMEAEDMVQETYLRYEATDTSEVQSLKSFLCTITTRLCLDQLKSARMQREEYIGPWLPEPLITENLPLRSVDQKEKISMAFLVLLESLSPVERAVFLLREVFDYGYDEIAQIVDKSEANCRQLYSRAKKYVVDRRPRFDPSLETQQKIVGGFMQALTTGDLNSLEALLAEDVHCWSDGGGKVFAARKPMHGRPLVIRFMQGLMRLAPADSHVELQETNGTLSLMIYTGVQLYGVMNFLVAKGQITEIRSVVNPDKLQHLQG